MDDSAKYSFLVVGSINMDLILESGRMPLPGESLMGARYSYAAGGKGANQAVALARLGARATLVGRVGNDPNGQALLASLQRDGVNVEFVSQDEKTPTGLAAILLREDAENRILVFPGANMNLDTTDLCRAFKSAAYDALVLQLEVSRELVIEACALARQAGIPIVLDAGPAQEFPLECVPGIEILTPNETETLALTGITVGQDADAEIAAARLLERSKARAVVIKLGAAGAFVRTTDGICARVPAPKVNAADPTAAGDAFTAAMTLQFLKTGDLLRSVTYGNLAGALAATKVGAQNSLPTAEEIEEFRETALFSGALHV